jgi:hypothetical protein
MEISLRGEKRLQAASFGACRLTFLSIVPITGRRMSGASIVPQWNARWIGFTCFPRSPGTRDRTKRGVLTARCARAYPDGKIIEDLAAHLVVELGAGSIYWARLIADKGGDVAAFGRRGLAACRGVATSETVGTMVTTTWSH